MSFGLSVRSLAALLLISVLHEPSFADEPKGIVSITFDDATTSQYENGLRIATDYGLVGTIFVSTGLVRGGRGGSTDPHFMDWTEVRAFHDAGWEIGAHGRTHLDLTELGGQDVVSEIVDPITEIETMIGVRPQSFSSPFGRFNHDTVARILEHYDNHVMTWGGQNRVDAIDRGSIGREQVDDESASEICGMIVRASIRGDWLILLFHNVTTNDPSTYRILVESFEDILSCAAHLRDNGLIDVLTVAEAMDRIDASVPDH